MALCISWYRSRVGLKHLQVNTASGGSGVQPGLRTEPTLLPLFRSSVQTLPTPGPGPLSASSGKQVSALLFGTFQVIHHVVWVVRAWSFHQLPLRRGSRAYFFVLGARSPSISSCILHVLEDRQWPTAPHVQRRCFCGRRVKKLKQSQEQNRE